MKIFIGGSKTINVLSQETITALEEICLRGYEILIGDCFGADFLVQKFLCERGYNNVTVYASEGKVRHNEGDFPVKDIPVNRNINGFEYYRQKDFAMEKDADCALMLWDGKTRGTLCNIEDMKSLNKPVRIIMY